MKFQIKQIKPKFKIKKGKIFVNLTLIIDAMNYIIHRRGYKIPYVEYQDKRSMPKTVRKKILQEQGKFFDQIISFIQLEVINKSFHIFFIDNETRQDITGLLKSKNYKQKNTINVLKYPNAIDRAIKLSKKFINKHQNTLPLVLINTPYQKQEKDMKIITLHELDREEQMELRRKELLKLLSTGKIIIYPEIDLKKDWPVHPLIDHIRRQIIPMVNKVMKHTDLLFDPQDLEHQILFRLTTFTPSELFKKGSLLEGYFDQVGVYKNWQKIPKLDPKIISKFVLNQDIIQQIIQEQFFITQERMKKSKLPLNLIFRGLNDNDKIFTRKENERYKLRWQNTNRKKYLAAVKVNKYGDAINSIPVYFRKINQMDLGKRFIRDLHYLHTIRSGEDMFGLYLRGSKFPFAIEVVGCTKNSPLFRQDALLIRGFNLDYGIELTRLYTWPGSPRNIIGLIDRLVTEYYKKSKYNIEVVITTMTPTYAKTRSTTIASGIDQVLYVRPLSHKFVCRKINGMKVWEHITIRNLTRLRISKSEVIETNPKFPLYPSVGVYKQIKKRSFNELSMVRGKIIGFDF